MTDEELAAMASRKKARTLARKTKEIRTIQARRTIWILFAGLIVLIDQLSKWAVMELMVRPARYKTEGLSFYDWYMNKPNIIPFTELPVTSFFNIVLAWNRGVSFSLLNNLGDYGYVILIIIALIIITIFSIWLWTSDKHFPSFCTALVIGGALGNVIDRFRFGAVIDFLDFHIDELHWPAFNIADMAVVSGIFLLITVSLFSDVKIKQKYRKAAKERRKQKELHEQRFGLK